MRNAPVVVIGGGLSGLAFAHHHSRTGRRVVVLEADSRLGGCVLSERAPGGFWFELGAHTCYNSYGGVLELLRACGLNDAIVARRKAPFRVETRDGVRSVTSVLSFVELLGSAWRLFTAPKAGRTVRDYYGSLVGRRNYERLFSRFFAAVPSQPADDFPADMLFKKRGRDKNVPRSFTLEGGLSTLIDALARGEGIEVRTGAKVSAIGGQAPELRVDLTSGESLVASAVALAVPPDVAARLLTASFAPLAADLERIGVAAIDSYGVVVEAGQVKTAPLAGLIPLIARGFYSVVSRDVVPDGRYRAFTFHGPAGAEPAARRREAETVLGLDPSAIVYTASRSVFLPSPRLGHAELVSRLDGALRGTGLALLGNYFAGLSLEDCVQRAKGESARLASA